MQSVIFRLHQIGIHHNGLGQWSHAPPLRKSKLASITKEYTAEIRIPPLARSDFVRLRHAALEYRRFIAQNSRCFVQEMRENTAPAPVANGNCDVSRTPNHKRTRKRPAHREFRRPWQKAQIDG